MKFSKKLAFTFILFFFISSILFTILVSRLLYNTIKSSTLNELKIETNSYKNNFEKNFEQLLTNITIYSEFLKDNLTLDKLADYEEIKKFEPEMKSLGKNIVKSQNILNIYAWFLPDYVPEEWMMISIRNKKLDGNIIYVNSTKYTNEDIKTKDFDWFLNPIKNGLNYTDPYKFPAYEDNIVTIASPISIEDKIVGVVGCDTHITTIKNIILSNKFLNSGYYALFNKNLKCIVGPASIQGKYLYNIYKYNPKKLIDLMNQKNNNSIELETTKTNQIISYSKMNNGWFMVAIPNMNEIYQPIYKFILRVIFSVLIFILIMILIIVFLSRKFTFPINSITQKMVNIQSLNFKINLDYDSPYDEIKLLTSSFNNAIDKIKENQLLISDIFDSITSGIFIIDKELNIVQYNSYAEKELIKEKKVINKNILKIFPELKKIDLLKKIKMNKNYLYNKFKLKNKKLYNISINSLIHNQKSLYILQLIDVTDIEKKDELFRQSQKMETVGKLAGGIAHDFNNVITGINGTVSLIKLNLIKDKIDQKELKNNIDIIEESSKRASGMVQQLLSISRKQKYDFKVFNLKKSILNVFKLCKNSFPKEVNLTLKYSNIDENKEINIYGNKNQIQQVVLNICINASHAVTFMSSEKIKNPSVQIMVEEVKSTDYFITHHPDAEIGQYYLIHIIDNGVGMSSKTIAKIFDPFFTTKDKKNGTGLGLAMSYNTIRDHNGFIDVYSEKDQGTSFNIYLPKTTEKNIKKSEIGDEQKIYYNTGTILVIDDEKIVRNIVINMLIECGYQVISANNPIEGLKLYKENLNQIDIVITDLSMPEMSGDELFYKIKEIKSNQKIILTSGFINDSRILELRKKHNIPFIKKPFSINELSKLIYSCIMNKKS